MNIKEAVANDSATSAWNEESNPMSLLFALV